MPSRRSIPQGTRQGSGRGSTTVRILSYSGYGLDRARTHGYQETESGFPTPLIRDQSMDPEFSLSPTRAGERDSLDTNPCFPRSFQCDKQPCGYLLQNSRVELMDSTGLDQKRKNKAFARPGTSMVASIAYTRLGPRQKGFRARMEQFGAGGCVTASPGSILDCNDRFCCGFANACVFSSASFRPFPSACHASSRDACIVHRKPLVHLWTLCDLSSARRRKQILDHGSLAAQRVIG